MDRIELELEKKGIEENIKNLIAVIATIDAEVCEKKKELVEYSELGDVCPVCKQAVIPEFRSGRIDGIEVFIESKTDEKNVLIEKKFVADRRIEEIGEEIIRLENENKKRKS